MNILLLEDNSTDVDLTQIGLKHDIPNCNIQVASSVKEALHILHEGAVFDVALLDMELPDGNGLDILLEIRHQKYSTAVIILTGSGNVETAVSALKAGANDYIIKRGDYIQNLPDTINIALEKLHNTIQENSGFIDVLYIEHHLSDIDLTIRHLKKYAPHIHIHPVHTPEQALELLEKDNTQNQKYNVILMDYSLSGLNAFELTKIIRYKLEIKIPIIFVTGQGNEEIAVQGLKIGANDYLTKNENYLFRLPSLIQNAYQHEELIRKKEALEKSENRYRLLAENSGDVIFVLNMDLDYIYVSPAVKTLRGYSSEEAIKQNIKEVLTPESYQRVRNIIQFLLESLKDKQTVLTQQLVELEMIKKDKTTVWTEVKASVFMNEEHKPAGILGVTRDITEKKKIIDELIKAKEMAEESSRLKTAFLANISHEIRTPLNGILGFTQLLQNTKLTQKKREMYFNILQSSGERMLNTINNIIEISQIETDHISIHTSNFNINELIVHYFNSYRPEVEKKGLSFILVNEQLPDDLIIRTDRKKFESILSSLLKNAIKFTSEGSIEFGCEINEKTLTLYVKDTGIGIPRNRQASVFNLFEQADLSNTRPYEGAGLGLSISRSYAKLMGGDILVESEEGAGSIFRLIIPRVNIEPDKLNKSFESVSKDIAPHGELLLIVEDDEINFKYIQELLKSYNFRILHSITGENAIELCHLHPDIDLVLMDIKLPFMSGYEAIKKIRTIRKDLPIIAQTAYAMEYEKEKVLLAGCNDYISKPFDKKALISIIDKYIRK